MPTSFPVELIQCLDLDQGCREMATLGMETPSTLLSSGDWFAPHNGRETPDLHNVMVVNVSWSSALSLIAP